MFTQNIPYSTAFIAGLLSFFSPCVLPLIPAYFTFITGYSIEELTSSRRSKKKIFIPVLAYIAGFSTVFIAFGASASYLGQIAYNYKEIIRYAGGIIIIILGIHLTGIFRIKWLEYDRRFNTSKKPLHFFSIFIIGAAFGAGWSPCIGPMLGSILIIAGSQETLWQGVRLLAIYSAGLAIPFIIIAIFINKILIFFKKAVKILKYINIAAGTILIIVGLLLLFNKLG
ncbi:MAG: sulfite exporter TauE/SafE family protein [Deltaproteobacteria bacterium]|nr:sulfite exporter TauE/SafE family protein [Deltaproteobacteria bacterium]